MSLKPKLSQSQRLALTPALRQSLNILAMPLTDLTAVIEAEAAENPFLQVDHPGGDGSAYDYALATSEAPITLAESVRQQIAVMSLPDLVRDVALYLVGDLTDDGFLETEAEEVAADLRVAPDVIDQAITALQECEPVGVGAQNLTEGLTLQLIAKGITQADAEDATRHLDLFATRDWAKLQKTTGWPSDKMHKLAELIGTLSPFPAERFGETAQPITPDVLVEPDGQDGHRVMLARGVAPSVTLDRTLLAAAKGDAAAQEYSKERQARADALINAIAFRGRTLLRLVQAIIVHQHRFFSGDFSYLAPLTQVELAATLEVHPTTVCRAIAGKYVQVSGAIYPVSFFLTRATKSKADTGPSAYTVQQLIRRMIDAERPSAPLSDDEIVKKLKTDGVDIARRTVAKYRGCMNIPSSFERRRNAALQRTRPAPPGGVRSVKR